MRSPLIPEAQLRHDERKQKEQHFSYDLTQRLTYYVITAELIFCGYVLLNSEKFGVIKHSSVLFLLAGIAALSGVLWRFGYNQNQHDIAHDTYSKQNEYISIAQRSAYWVYVTVTFFFFISLLIIGYSHLAKIESVAKGNHEESSIEVKNKETPESTSALEIPATKSEREKPPLIQEKEMLGPKTNE